MENTPNEELENLKVPDQQWSISCLGEGKLQIKKIPVERPGAGQVLVKCLAAPINPSDLAMMKGWYS